MRVFIGILLAISLTATGAMAYLASHQQRVSHSLAMDWRQNPYLASLTTEARVKNLMAVIERRTLANAASQLELHRALDDVWAQLTINREPVLAGHFDAVFGGAATLDRLSREFTRLDPDIRLIAPDVSDRSTMVQERLDGLLPLLHALTSDSRELVDNRQRALASSEAWHQNLMLSALVISLLSQLALFLVLSRELAARFTVQQFVVTAPKAKSVARAASKRAGEPQPTSPVTTEGAEAPDTSDILSPGDTPADISAVDRMRAVVADVFERGQAEPREPDNWDDALADMPVLPAAGPIMATVQPKPSAPVLNWQSAPLVPLLDRAIMEAAPAMATQQVVTACYVDPAMPSSLTVDIDAVATILRQLLGNAYKFTPCGGVVLSADVIHDGLFKQLRLTVLDTGIGIAAEDRDLIFHDQVQVQPGRGSIMVPFDAEQRGIGLGLSQARDLARRMGGDIRAFSQPGLGSRFTVTLPLREPGPPVASTLELHGRAYLIVDHSPVRGQVLADQLRALGAEVMLADHEMAALDAVNGVNTEALAFDMAILTCDSQHPGAAFALAKRLRSASNGPRRIALARPGGDEFLPVDDLAMELAEHVMTLPLTTDDLLAVLRLRVIDPISKDRSPRLTDARMADLMQQIQGVTPEVPLRPKALMLELNEADTRHVRTLMTAQGWHLEQFLTVSTLLDAMTDDHDAVLVSVGESDDAQRDALTVLKAHRQHGHTAPLIGLIERDISELTREYLLAAGFDTLLTKPIAAKALNRSLPGANLALKADNAGRPVNKDRVIATSEQLAS
ncbi:MAG: ATP-binding protein [Pseudomonadota bacterium]